MIPGLKDLYEKLIAFFAKIDVRLLLFILLCLNFLSFRLSSNEEVYLPLARQFMDPAWIPDSFVFTEWPGNRYLFQVIAGFALKYLSFEQVAFWGRLLVFAITVFPLGKLIKKLDIGNLAAIFLLQLYLIRPNYFAGEFIFGDFEPKSLAYIAVFAGLNSLLDKKHLMSAVWATVASYFHILVGGWFYVLVLLYTFFRYRSVILPVRQLLLFSVLIAPLAWYLSSVIISDGSVINGVNIDRVSVFYRNAHHLAPLYSKEQLPAILSKILMSAFLFALTLFVFRKKKGPLFDELFLLNVIILTLLFVFLPVSLVDKNGTLLKFYLFRLAGIGMLLMILYIFKFLSAQWKPSFTMLLILTLGGFYLVLAASVSTFSKFISPGENPENEQLKSYIVRNTDLHDRFILLYYNDLAFSRNTRREVFVNYKCDPGGGEKIYEWYHRVGELNKLMQNINYLDTLASEYRLDYLVSEQQIPSQSNLELVFNNQGYYLYRINKNEKLLPYKSSGN
jgi:hypothetical protein